ncbi:MAG: hypothetical protein HDR01_01180 [Lachnospiraceae bacterium]|nr:hypothetical protein [Lachnospiraceae bacterium]
MNCLWILVLLFLCNNGRCSDRHERHDRHDRDDDCDCGRDRSNSSNDDCGGGSARRFTEDNGLFDMPRGGEAGRVPSNFQRGTCGCEIQE